MEENKCPQCGAPIDPGATECKFCGEKFSPQQMAQFTHQTQSQGQPQQMNQNVQPQGQPQVIINQQINQPGSYSTADPSWPLKSKTTAAILALFLGGLGIHKFYLGQIGMGILYICFCWTCIPEIVGVIEGIVYLCTSDANFEKKYHVRLS